MLPLSSHEFGLLGRDLLSSHRLDLLFLLSLSNLLFPIWYPKVIQAATPFPLLSVTYHPSRFVILFLALLSLTFSYFLFSLPKDKSRFFNEIYLLNKPNHPAAFLLSFILHLSVSEQ